MKTSKAKLICGIILALVFGINQIGFTLVEYFVNDAILHNLQQIGSVGITQEEIDNIQNISKLISLGVMILATIPVTIVAIKKKWDFIKDGVAFAFVGVVMRLLNIGFLADIWFLLAGSLLAQAYRTEKKATNASDYINKW